MKNICYSIFLFSVFAFAIFVAPHHLLAQSSIPELGDTLNISTYPSQPAPNQSISVNLAGAGINIDTVKITWLVDGKIVASGVGLKSITTTTGSVGSKTTISVSAATPMGNVSKTISIQPASVHLSWEGVTYTPSFYKGAALPSSESAVTIVAFPDIQKGAARVASDSLVYTWKVNGSVAGSASGYGKSSFLYRFPQISRPVTIEVLVSTTDQSLGANASVVISPSDTTAIVYEENPALGLMTNKAVDSLFTLTNTESRFVAVPYYFSASSRADSKLNYKWSVGGTQVSSAANDQSAIVLRPQAGATGNSQVSVEVNQTDTILQTARSVFTVLFGQGNK